MTEQQIIDYLNKMQEGDDHEVCHGQADDMLSMFLVDNGYPELAKAYEEAGLRVGFYYA